MCDLVKLEYHLHGFVEGVLMLQLKEDKLCHFNDLVIRGKMEQFANLSFNNWIHCVTRFGVDLSCSTDLVAPLCLVSLDQNLWTDESCRDKNLLHHD